MKPAATCVFLCALLHGCASNPPTPVVNERYVTCPLVLASGQCPDMKAPWDYFKENKGFLTPFRLIGEYLDVWKAYRSCKRRLDAIERQHELCLEDTGH